MRIIEQDGHILAKHITPSDIKSGLSFFSDDKDFIQVGTWKYEADKNLPAHIHNNVERTINRTCEVLHVLKGKLEASIYTLDERLVEKLILTAGDILVLLECGHGYKILEDGTTVLEIKNGPYPGAEVDRRRISVEEYT